MARTNGLRKVGNGWKNDSLYQRSKPSAPEPTPEQKAKTSALMDEAVAALEAGNAEAFFAAMRDRDARLAVEGDTDLNHDNLEG